MYQSGAKPNTNQHHKNSEIMGKKKLKLGPFYKLVQEHQKEKRVIFLTWATVIMSMWGS